VNAPEKRAYAYKEPAGSQYHMYFTGLHTKTPHRWTQGNKTTLYTIFYITNSRNEGHHYVPLLDQQDLSFD
jgi:hypothetical protein